MRLSKAITLCLGLATIPVPALAQEYTTDQLRQLFSAQRDTFRELTKTGGMKTRGLTMVTVDDLETQPEVASTGPTSPPTPETGGNTTITSATDTTQPRVTPVMFGKLAPELQVNVRIQFDFDSAVIADSQKPKLAQLCQAMKPSDIKLFRIAGHTDTSGSDAYNEKLSLLRAEEVKRYFTDECGMDPSRIEAIGLGERFPFNSDDPKAAENRRVEFQALS